MEIKEKVTQGKREFEIKDFKVLENTDNAVRIAGYANTKNMPDRYGDIPTVYPDKRDFVYSLADYKKNPVLLIDHENNISHLAGSVDIIHEDEKGLYFEATFSKSNYPEVAHARTVYTEGHAKGISIAGRFHYENVNAPNQLTLAEIYEISLVAIPADSNSLAAVIDTGEAEVEKALGEASNAAKSVLDSLEINKVVKDVQKTKALLTGKAR